MGRSLFGTDEKSIFWFNWDPSGITTSLTAVAVLSFSIYAMIVCIPVNPSESDSLLSISVFTMPSVFIDSNHR